MALLALRAVRPCRRLASPPGAARLVFFWLSLFFCCFHFQGRLHFAIVFNSIKFQFECGIAQLGPYVVCFIGRDSLNAVHFKCRDSPTLCILKVGTVPTLCIQNVGTVLTVPTFSPSELVHLTICLIDVVHHNGVHYLSLRAGTPQ